jgi:hypothetical protein
MPTAPSPLYCAACCLDLTSEAELFLHTQVHTAPWGPLRNDWSLRVLPYALMPRVAEVMQAYAEAYAAKVYHGEG